MNWVRSRRWAFYTVIVRVQFFWQKIQAFHSKSKHIQKKYQFVCYLVEDKLVIFDKICGSKNLADLLIKGVIIEKLKLCVASVGLLD